jgi:hypothetical protein
MSDFISVAELKSMYIKPVEQQADEAITTMKAEFEGIVKHAMREGRHDAVLFLGKSQEVTRAIYRKIAPELIESGYVVECNCLDPYDERNTYSPAFATLGVSWL